MRRKPEIIAILIRSKYAVIHFLFPELKPKRSYNFILQRVKYYRLHHTHK